MKILVVSGFLGAGKTTFIKELAKRTKKDFAVMENEFGAVGVDADFLEDGFSKGDKTLNIWEMTEGCILLFGENRFCYFCSDNCQYSGSRISDRRAYRRRNVEQNY